MPASPNSNNTPSHGTGCRTSRASYRKTRSRNCKPWAIEKIVGINRTGNASKSRTWSSPRSIKRINSTLATTWAACKTQLSCHLSPGSDLLNRQVERDMVGNEHLGHDYRRRQSMCRGCLSAGHTDGIDVSSAVFLVVFNHNSHEDVRPHLWIVVVAGLSGIPRSQGESEPREDE